jgi:hypothetical protein
LPVFLSGHADEHEQEGSLLLLNASILVMTATLVGIAITLSWGSPVRVFADVTASRTDFSARWPGTDQSTPKIQSTAAQGSAPTAGGAPTRDEIAAASEPASQSQTKISEPPAEALLKQFQAWAAEKDAQAQAGPVQPVQDAPAKVVQDAPSPVAENAPASTRRMQQPREANSAQNARAEIRRVQKPRATVQR